MWKIKLNLRNENTNNGEMHENLDKPSSSVKKQKGKKKKTLEEIREYEREKKRRQRAKMTEEQKIIKKQKDIEYNRDKRKKMEDLTERQKRVVRRQGRERSARFREKKKLGLIEENILATETPPHSDTENNLVLENQILESRRLSGRKRKNRNRAKVYRDMKVLQLKLKIAERRAERLKKRLQRMKKERTPSPNTEFQKLVGRNKLPTPVKRRLIFSNELVMHLEKEKKAIKPKQKEYSLFSKMVASNRFKKLRVIKQASPLISYKMLRKITSGNTCRKKRRDSVLNSVIGLVKDFLEEDTNSRMCPGKKDVVIFRKKRAQKRLLLDSLKNLHQKFNKTSNKKISYSTFLKCRPFYIIPPKLSDRDTCVCIKHANITYMVSKLRSYNIINVVSPNDLVNNTVCSNKNKDCMYRKCKQCMTKKVEYCLSDEMKTNHIKYFQYINEKEERVIKERKVQVRITSRKEFKDSIPDLIHKLETSLPEFRQHIFNIYHQHSTLKELKSTMCSNEIIIHIDFSENYLLKYSNEEVQAMHFGASQKQISLHTGVYYIREGEATKALPHSFCTISDNLDHGSHAIWSHLKPILKEINEKFPHIDTYHFQSDGPTSQYKNKFNIFFLINYLPTLVKHVKKISWNFSVAGHGKGAADGVGGVLKRTADALVSQGKDILSAAQFVEKLSVSCKKISLHEVKNEDITNMKNYLSQVVTPIKKITSLHQVTWTVENPAKLHLRALSCFVCDLNTRCLHYGEGETKLLRILFFC